MAFIDLPEDKNRGFLKSIDRKKLQEAYKDFMVEEQYGAPYECEVGDEACLENEICVPTKKRSPLGKCTLCNSTVNLMRKISNT